MLKFFRRLAQQDGLLLRRRTRPEAPPAPLRVLLVGAIMLPVTLYAVASAISYHQHFDDARDRLRRNLAIVHEHAQKVFETFEFASRYLDEMTAQRHATSRSAPTSVLFRAAARDDDVAAAIARPLDHRRRRLSAGVGHGVSDAADRSIGPQLFQGPSRQSGERPVRHRGAGGRAANTRFFAISRKREINGQFAGVTIVSIAPEYFSEFYSQLPPPGPRRCCAPTAWCWRAIRTFPARSRGCARTRRS